MTQHGTELAEQLYNADPHLVEQAMAAVEADKAMGFMETFKVHRKAAMWSMALSLALVMEGYDVGIINSFWGHRAFLEQFGSVSPDGQRYIPANWQAALNNAASIGQITGLAICGWAQPRFGSRPVYICGMIAMIAAIFIPVFSNSLPMLFAGEIICGIPWGLFQTLTVAYAAEICPIAMRGYLTAFVNMCWGFGLLLSAGVVRASIEIDSQWGWRLPFMLQWVWPPFLLAVGFCAPESPWWLVKAGRTEDARKMIARLAPTVSLSEPKTDQQIAMMQHTIALEKAETRGSSIQDCFKQSNRRRTEIVLMVWIVQYWSGQNIVNYMTQFLQTGGMSEAGAFNMSLGINACYIVGTAVFGGVMYLFGRRTIYMWGFVGLGVLMLIVGILGFLSAIEITLAIGGLMVVINFWFSITLAPVCYTIAAEIPASRVRAQTLALGRIVYCLSSVVCNQLTPRMFSVAEWNWGARSALFWLLFDVLAVVYIYFRVPETKGRSYMELNILFANGVPARKFASTVVKEINIVRDEKIQTDVEDKGAVAHHEIVQ